MEEALRILLRNAAAIEALVASRVDWGLRPQGAPLPAVALHQVSGIASMTMTGPAAWSRDRIQADCWGQTYKAARDLADAVAITANGFRGTVSERQLRVFVLDRRSDTDADESGPVFRTSLDLQVWHNP